MDEKEANEPKLWITALKILAVALLMIGGAGLALWYFAHEQRFDDPNKPPDTPANSWGIVNDSPVRSKR